MVSNKAMYNELGITAAAAENLSEMTTSLAYDFGLAVPDFVKTWILGALIWISTALTIISGLVYLKGCWKYIDGDK